MKYPIILTLIILFSCQKQEDVKTIEQSEVVVDYLIPTMGKPGKGNGHGQGGNQTPPPPPPTDTTTPPPPTTGNVIYVDMDGEQINSTQWGYFYATPPNITEAQKTEVVNYAANHYAPYNVTVTSDVNIYNNADPLSRVKIVVTDYAFRGGASGFAVRPSFGTGVEAFVFSSVLLNTAKYIGDIVSHEAGHTLNLMHQSDCSNGVLINTFRDGAIMGYPYNSNPALWVTGTASNCLIQNDNELLQSKLGLR